MPPTPIALEPVDASEAEDLVALRIEAMRESLERVGRFDPQRARNRFLDGFVPANTFHIAVAGERVGFCALRREDGTLHLDHLYVRPQRQGEGIGAAVLSAVFERADREGLAVRVGALKESASNRFYRRHGFAPVGEGEFDVYYARAPKPA